MIGLSKTNRGGEGSEAPRSSRNHHLNRRIWAAAQALDLTHDQVSDINHMLSGHRIRENNSDEDIKLYADLRARMKEKNIRWHFNRKSPKTRHLQKHHRLDFMSLITAPQVDLIRALSEDLGLSIPGLNSISRRACGGRNYPQNKGEATALIAALKSMLRRI